MRHAYRELERGDRLQASEKAWGAVAHRLKVVADNRGLAYESHLQAFDVERAILPDAPDPERMSMLFAIAHALHQNYYIDFIPPDMLRQRLDRTQELLDILEGPEFSGNGNAP